MGLLTSVVRSGRKAIDQAAMSSPYDPVNSWDFPVEAYRTWTGYGITPETAYNIITVYQCARVLAETYASVPLLVYRRLPGGGKERADDHPLFDVLHREPNPEMSSFVWRELMMGHLATWGNAYNEKLYDRGGRLTLWPIRPDRIEVKWDPTGTFREYWYLKPSGERVKMPPDSILHLQGLSSNGLVGLSPISMMRSTLRLFKTAERYGTTFFDNDARPGTILSHPKNLSKPAIERLAGQMESMKGAGNAGKTVVLEEGLTVHEVGIHPEDAQFMETRLFQKREIAGAFRIPPHKIGDLERATFTNIEHQSIEFIQDAMVPWFVRSEMDMGRQLIAPTEQKSVFVSFLVDGYLRGDAKTRAEALAIRWQHGNINADEWRALENENPLPDGVGETYYVPANYLPADEPRAALGAPETGNPTPNPDASGTSLSVDEVVAGFQAGKALGEFKCPECGKLINRLAFPGTVGYCRSCKTERTMVVAAVA